MLPYWFLFLSVAWMAVTHMRPVPSNVSLWRKKREWGLVLILLVTMIGWRYEVGGDWRNYLEYVDALRGKEVGVVFAGRGDPAYLFLNWLGANLGGGIYFVNVVCAFVFSIGLLSFCYAQPRPWLALAVAVPYLVIVVAMGYTRQGVAIGLAMLAVTALRNGRFLRFVLWIAGAAAFHKTAVILVPFAIFSGKKNRWMVALGILTVTVLLYALLLQEAVYGFQVNYLEAGYDSSGAAIRVAMNTIPAILFLVFRRQFVFVESEYEFWRWIALSALLFVPLLILSPSSTAVDRLALYWIPLQLFVFARLPDVLGQLGKRNPLVVYGVLLYSALTLFVWLFFASHAYAWIPYRFYPWTWLWSWE